MKTWRGFFAFLLLPLTAPLAAEQPGSLDLSFHAPPGLGAVASIAPQSDGKVLVGGTSLGRLNVDGSRDGNFNVGTGPNGAVTEVLLQRDGKPLVAGHFTQINNIARPFIARLNPDGSLDLTFHPGIGPDAPVTALALQTDGKIIIGGGFVQVDRLARYAVARLNVDGSVDHTFDASTFIRWQPGLYPAEISDLITQPDDKILVGGALRGANATNLARLNADGSHDIGFAPEPLLDGVFALALQPDGKVLAAGGFWTPRLCLARFLPDGSLDDFSPDIADSAVDPYVTAVALERDRRILFGGNNLRGAALGRVSADGTTDTTFDASASIGWNVPLAIALQPDGKVLVGSERGIVRLNNDVSRSGSLAALIAQVQNANLGQRTRPLIASLNAAAASLEAGMVDAALGQLRAFQHKVRALLGRSDPPLAEALIQAAQDIIDW